MICKSLRQRPACSSLILGAALATGATTAQADTAPAKVRPAKPAIAATTAKGDKGEPHDRKGTEPKHTKHHSQSRRPFPTAASRSHSPRTDSVPAERVGAANAAARIQPERAGFVNAVQVYPWQPGALYQVYAKPGQVSDIALQEGEQLVGTGPVASGDTVRWMIGDTLSGIGSAARVHILVKPIRPDITTNLVINTDRRTYHLELRANPSVYMASVSWTYPQDELIALRARAAEAERLAPVAAGLDLGALNFRYRIEGDHAEWRPARAFDDGTRVFVEFPDSVAQSEMPPLFVIGVTGEAELVNYRVSGRYMIVDRLFSRAELRLGTGKHQQVVRIARDGGKGAQRVRT